MLWQPSVVETTNNSLILKISQTSLSQPQTIGKQTQNDQKTKKN